MAAPIAMASSVAEAGEQMRAEERGVMSAYDAAAPMFECHRMLPDVEEFLYSAMEDFQISISMESGMQGRAITLPLKRFTLVGATTREGLLSEPFRARFGILEKLEWYPVADLVKILRRSSRILKTDIDDESAGLLAQRARGTPRVANRYLRRVRDLAEVKSAKSKEGADLKIREDGSILATGNNGTFDVYTIIAQVRTQG